MKRVTYPGTNNFTDLIYDPLGRCVKMVETTNGSVTSTKQFIWCGSSICEERDASGNLVTQFFPLGYKTGGNSFYYNLDHLGSVREVTNSSGAIVAQISYSPWGEPTLLQGSALPDFGYAGMYYHARSGLNLTLYRAYSPSLGRWLSRDPLRESAGVNLYGYVSNNPVSRIDPLGLQYKLLDSNPTGGYGKIDSSGTTINYHWGMPPLPEPGRPELGPVSLSYGDPPPPPQPSKTCKIDEDERPPRLIIPHWQFPGGWMFPPLWTGHGDEDIDWNERRKETIERLRPRKFKFTDIEPIHWFKENPQPAD